MDERRNAAWFQAELNIALWYADAALRAPTPGLAHRYIKIASDVCNAIAAALTEAALLSEELKEIEEGLAAVRLRLQSLEEVEPEPK